MSLPDSLQTIAEVGVALAGFSGLVVALRKKTGPLSEVEKYRLQVLLTLAFGAVFLSFLPEILTSLELQTGRAWLYSGFALCIYSIVFLSWWMKATRNFIHTFPEIFHWTAFTRMILAHVAVIVLQLSAAFSLIPVSAATAFVIALVWYLIHSAQQFVRMLFVQPNSAISEKTSAEETDH